MAPPKPSVPAAAQPTFGAYFDAWNSSSTGHQRAENRIGSSIGWRQSRTMKLNHQFKSGGSDGTQISDHVGAGSEDWHEKANALTPKYTRERAKRSGGDILAGKVPVVSRTAEERLLAERLREDELMEEKRNQSQKIFHGLVFYINGSTYPRIGDHKLKHLLAENGAKISLHLGRKHVTHVILGNPLGCNGAGAGGGLSTAKIEKEVKRVGGCGIKYVGVEWVLESMKAGKRLQEAPFANVKVASKEQQGVYMIFQKGNRWSS